MVNRKYVLGIAIVLFMCLLFASNASANPSISNPTNNKTNNNSLAFTVNETETVKFIVGNWNESVNVTWNWFVDGNPQSGDNRSDFTYTFSTSADRKIKVNLTNKTTGQNSNSITWDVTVQPLPPKPHITGWRNNKTNGSSLNITINLSDTVKFNATANQTIQTWNWYVNGSKQSIASDTYSYQFNIAGTHKIKVDAQNENGTSDNKEWSVFVEDNNPPADITHLTYTNGTTWIRWNWTNPSPDYDHAMVYLDGDFKRNVSGNSYNTSQDTALDPKTSHNISLRPVDASDNKGNWTNGSAKTDAERPIIKRDSPNQSKFESGIETKTFSIQLTKQTANVTWTGAKSQTNTSVSPGDFVYLNFTPSDTGTYIISVSAQNENGTSNIISWNWTVHSATFSSGNRIWDGSKPNDFDLTYSWTPQSFSGFYYNAKDDVGNENIKITLHDYNSRTINEGDLVYSTSPQNVSFTHSGFGSYQVMGFMAEKYFAGYTAKTISTGTRPTTDFEGKSTVAQHQLHKVLIDDDTQRTISVGGTIALKEGYVLKARDIDLNARQMLLSLLKDGNEVDVSPLSADQTYVYSKTVGGVESLPLIMVRFDNVFSGQEMQAAFMKGMFQISEDATKVEQGNSFSNMEVTSVSQNGIEMKNSGNIGLSKGTTATIMGDVKIIAADNDSVVRFALSVEKTGDFEVRSTIYRDEPNPISVWTPYNFGMNLGKTSVGFYYDLDDGVGSEKLELLHKVSGRSIPDQDLKYSTTPQDVKFTYTGFGKYQVIGFMADKYFAGYTENTGISSDGKIITRPSTDFEGLSTLANNNLHKVLIDDDTKRTISVGGTIALKEGYVLKATDIDLRGRTMLLSLLKDGSEVDVSPLSAGETYVYAKTVGGTESLPLIMVRFETVFSGQELQAAFLRGMFQISEDATKVQSGDQFGKMEVKSVTRNEITMSNDGSIGLDRNKNDVLMGNLRLKVADNADALRFYFAVDVTADMIENQLVIDAPAKVMAGDNINIKVTAGGNVVDNASIILDTDIGTTDIDGLLNYSIPKTLKNGTYTITATKTGYEKATKDIEIEKYVDYRLSIEAPTKANQYENINIKVLYNGTPMSDASVLFDNTSIGTTNSTGELNYRVDTSGTHSITASKTSYISVSRDIDIIAPYSEFKALDINITPNPVFTGEDFVVKSNITNVGTKSDTLPVELIINGSAVENRSVTLAAGEKVEINFTRNEARAANITVEILGQSNLLIVQQKSTSYLLIAAIATGIGAVIIYVLTSKGLLSLELLKQKFGILSQKFNLLFKK